MTPCLGQRGRCEGSGKREGYGQVDHGRRISQNLQESSLASFMKVISNQWVSNQFGNPRPAAKLSVLILELLNTFRGSVSIRLRFSRFLPLGSSWRRGKPYLRQSGS